MGDPARVIRARVTLLALLAGVALSVSVMEFVALQHLSDDDLRQRFNLPRDCDPQLTASSTPPGRLRVFVACAPRTTKPDARR
jgi:hypothetical protein